MSIEKLKKNLKKLFQYLCLSYYMHGYSPYPLSGWKNVIEFFVSRCRHVKNTHVSKWDTGTAGKVGIGTANQIQQWNKL